MIIGLTGSFCSGKDTVADYLVNRKGFRHLSLSDILRDELRARGIAESREHLIRIGIELRTRYGNSVLADRALDHCPEVANCVITSIRHPAEVNALRRRRDFHLITVEAPAELRFARMRSRDRVGDPETFEEFLDMEERERQTAGPGQQVQKCREMADISISNGNEGLDALFVRVERILAELGG